MKRRSFQIAIWSALAIALLFSMWLSREQWLWMPWNPRYSQRALLGLTKEQLLDRLGPPDFDPSQEAWAQPWNEKSLGPYYVTYFGTLGVTCVVTFQEGHVSEVRRGGK